MDKEREKVEENYCKKDLKTEDKERSTDAIYVHSRHFVLELDRDSPFLSSGSKLLKSIRKLGILIDVSLCLS